MSEPRTDSLRVHGDRFARAGMLDFAVNVWPTPRPRHLNEALTESLTRSGYPDESAARLAIGRRHARPVAQTLALDGACEAFWLLAHALPVRHAVCVHPSFTEAEAALRAAGRAVTRLMRQAGDWALDPGQVPEDADLVVLANPNNPTGNLDPPARIARLARPGRTLVVDESFIDFVPGERSSLASRRELPGLVVLRSLTKVWGLPGLRAGYLLAPGDLVERLAAHRQPWSVSTPALTAIETCLRDHQALAGLAADVAAAREDLRERLAGIPGVKTWPARANFVLIEVAGGERVIARLAAEGIAVRPCDSFPGLGTDHIRLAVRTPAEHAVLADAIARAIERCDPPPPVREPAQPLLRS
ncbi:MAG TPA: Rv2231c family pyridoxal phosphate-dependent protein CobC [Solirubrobacteraceae bacterium]|nr:Rv2231c family pyridoxal phosphate-dependent protein CobC [Solirubrobacteraceae bacterium]